MKQILLIRPQGVIVTLYSESLDWQALGQVSIERASDVEPDANGAWWAHLRDGPSLGPYSHRSQALTAEIDWLQQHRLQAE
ncbi:hypothetical protein [Planctopirus hydrillae]|uniref:Uncharacterized protein n=1 Tax=Planctopirus hydrillae TaxID=1841610 RepID=A0A1C3E933_9PLAN|nr:hypothetical protein [Planctopirus hydrillae]ODA29743.1 hypothetical protein A6X21_07585 [Planctopirus hydrillae]